MSRNISFYSQQQRADYLGQRWWQIHSSVHFSPLNGTSTQLSPSQDENVIWSHKKKANQIRMKTESKGKHPMRQKPTKPPNSTKLTTNQNRKGWTREGTPSSKGGRWYKTRLGSANTSKANQHILFFFAVVMIMIVIKDKPANKQTVSWQGFISYCFRFHWGISLVKILTEVSRWSRRWDSIRFKNSIFQKLSRRPTHSPLTSFCICR